MFSLLTLGSVSAVQGIPRTLALDSKTGVNLIEWPIEEVDALRGEQLSMTDVKLNAGALVEVEGAAGGQVSATKGPEIACSLHPNLKNHLQNWPLIIILVMVVHGFEMTWAILRSAKHQWVSRNLTILFICQLNGAMCSWMWR